MLHVPSLKPRLSNQPLRRVQSRRSQNVRGAHAPVGGAVEHVGFGVDVMHFEVRREPETESRGWFGAVVRSLFVDKSEIRESFV